MKTVKEYHTSKKLLIILLIVLISSFFANNIFADNLKLIKERTLNVKQGEKLFVDASGADIKVDSWNKDEVYVKIFGNRKAEDKMKFSIEKNLDGVEVTAKRESSWFFNWGGGYSVRIEVLVPANFDTEIETSGGDILVQNVKGKFDLETSGGDVDLKSTSGELKISTSGGDITINKHSGNSKVTTSGGDITTKELIGDLYASTSGGDINLDVINGKVMAKTSGGDIEIKYDGENKGINASTSGGDIKLYAPSTLKALVDLETSGGSIDCNFNNYKATKVTRGRVKGEFNGGGENLICRTTGGDIIIYNK